MDIELHPKVLKFAQMMQMELNANEHKGNWEEWNKPKDIYLDLEYHKAKLLTAMIKDKNLKLTQEYISDCANILMCLGNVYGFYDEDEETKYTAINYDGRKNK